MPRPKETDRTERLDVRVTADVRRAVIAEARRDARSLPAEVEVLLREAVAARREKEGT